MTQDVFISYSSKDQPAADQVCTALEQAGLAVWMAPRNIVAGDDWGGSIIEAINTCKIMVLVFSSHADRSPQVRREVERAVNKGVDVVPLRIENTLPTQAMEYFLSSTHWLDAYQPPLENHLQRLVDTVALLKDPARRGAVAREGRTWADSASPGKQVELALRYVRGEGVVADAARARQLLKSAAESGSAEAQYHLAEFDEEREDRSSAFQWYTRAARQGHAQAKARLEAWASSPLAANAEPGGDDAARENAGAEASAQNAGPDARASRRKLALRAVTTALLIGCVALILWVAQGTSEPGKKPDAGHTPADVPEARASAGRVNALIDRLTRGRDDAALAELTGMSSAGDAAAQVALANANLYGLGGINKNPGEALRLYRLAADSGNDRAQFFLGEMHENGIAVKKDLNSAVEWYRKAALQGHPGASAALRRLGVPQ